MSVHPLPVGSGDRQSGLSFDLRFQLGVPGRQHEGRRQPLHIPLEGALERLVEVIDIEYEPTIRRREQAKVGDVRISTELCSQATVRH